MLFCVTFQQKYIYTQNIYECYTFNLIVVVGFALKWKFLAKKFKKLFQVHVVMNIFSVSSYYNAGIYMCV